MNARILGWTSPSHNWLKISSEPIIWSNSITVPAKYSLLLDTFATLKSPLVKMKFIMDCLKPTPLYKSNYSWPTSKAVEWASKLSILSSITNYSSMISMTLISKRLSSIKGRDSLSKIRTMTCWLRMMRSIGLRRVRGLHWWWNTTPWVRRWSMSPYSYKPLMANSHNFQLYYMCKRYVVRCQESR